MGGPPPSCPPVRFTRFTRRGAPNRAGPRMFSGLPERTLGVVRENLRLPVLAQPLGWEEPALTGDGHPQQKARMEVDPDAAEISDDVERLDGLYGHPPTSS